MSGKSRRPECIDGSGTPMPRHEALLKIRNAVMRRRSLCYGQLHDGEGHHCAMGAFWEDNPGAEVPAALLEEVASINDAVVPTISNKERWKVVKAWLVDQVGW